MSETKNCPMCGEEILAVAKKCKHCGEIIEGASEELEDTTQTGLNKDLPGWVFPTIFIAPFFVLFLWLWIGSFSSSDSEPKASQIRAKAPMPVADNLPRRALTQEEESIVQEFRNASSQVRKKVGSKAYVTFQPDPLSDSGDCYVFIKGAASNWDINYQLPKSGSEAIYSKSQIGKGASFRLKGDSSDKIIDFDTEFGAGMGVPSRAFSFNTLINILSSSNKVIIDYGNLAGSNLTDTYDPTGFLSGYLIAQELCK